MISMYFTVSSCDPGSCLDLVLHRSNGGAPRSTGTAYRVVMTVAPPHEYIPAGPLAIEPAGGFQPVAVHRAAFAAVLAGVETGDYDHEVIAWLTHLDDTTCRVVTSLLWRCRQAPPLTEA
jgi:hypothetical protein